MSKHAINHTLAALAVPLVLATACADATPESADALNEHIAITSIEITSGDDLYLLHPIHVAVAAELSGEAFDTDLVIGMRTIDGSEGCVLGAMPVEHGGEQALDEGVTSPGAYANEAEFVIDRACYALIERDDVELFASFDPWNRLGDRELDTTAPSEGGGSALDLFSIVAAAAVGVEGCESCETTYSLSASPGLDAELEELNLSSVVAVLPVAAEGGEAPHKTTDRPDFSLTVRSRVVGLAKGAGLDDDRVHLRHSIRPLGSSGPGLPLLQRQGEDYDALAPVPTPSSGDVVSLAPLYIEDAARETLVDGSWSGLEEFELVTCLETDFDQAIYKAEDQPRANDCGSLPVVIVRQEVGADGLPTPTPGAAKVRQADVWGDSWWANAGYGFGQSGMMFEAWVEANAADQADWTYKGIRVHNAGAWFEAGFDFNAKVFGYNFELAEIYATFIAYEFGGGTVAMGASLFGDDFIPEFVIQTNNGDALTLQEVFDEAGVNAAPVVSESLGIAGVNFDDGCGSVDAGLWIEASAGLDANLTSATVSTTRQGVEVSGTITPFVDATAKAGTQVNYSEYIGGGITANLNLVNIALPFTVAVERIDYDPLAATRLSLNQYAQAHLAALSGGIYFNIYYTIPWPLCWSDCTNNHNHTIASWNGLNSTLTFFNTTSNIHVGDQKPSESWWCTHSNSEMHVGDFDGDGASDYLCHDVSNGNKDIDFNDAGNFAGTDWSQASGLCGNNGNFQLLVGDFDGDGRDDLMCHDIYWKAIDYADASGHFESIEWSAETTWCTASDQVIRSGDFNGDGRDDLYCHNYSGSKWLDYADASGHFGGTDWAGTVLPNSFCGLYDGQQIALGTTHGRFVQARSEGWGWMVDQATQVGSWERFTVECHGEKAALHTHHGRYLTARNASSDYDVSQQSVVGGWEKFIPVAQDDGSWSFLTYHGRYLMASDEVSDYEMKQQTRAGSWERFSVIPQ